MRQKAEKKCGGLMKITWILFLSLCSCSLFERSPHSYNQGTEVQTYLNQKNQHYVYTARKQLGLLQNQVFTNAQQNRIYTRASLLKAEDQLVSNALKKQYYLNRPYFASDSQRLHFLKLNSYAAKEDYLARYININRYPASISSAIAKQDLVPKMTKEAVIESWGKPENIEVSGNPIYSNEKWTYLNYVDSAEGEVEEKRYLYFEKGQLVSWQTAIE